MKGNPLAGAVAVVTGGESGIGAACVEYLTAAGARVALTYYSDRTAADAVVERCGGPERALAAQTDVADEAAVEALFAAAEAAFGTVTLAGQLCRAQHERDRAGRHGTRHVR